MQNAEKKSQKEMKQLLKVMVAGAYDFQDTRIRFGNRLVGNFKVKLGQDPGESEESLEIEAAKLLNRLRADYKSITEGVTTRITEKNFKQLGVISTFSELETLSSYLAMEKVEEEHFKRIGKMLTKFPIWNEFLVNVKGIGPALAGVLISNIDIEKSTYSTSLWKLAGLDVAWDGRGRSKRKEHLITVPYTTRTGAIDEKLSITYKPLLKAKLMGVGAASFLRVGREKSPYAAAYYDYKNRLENNFKHRDAFIALDLDKCKKAYGKLPKNIYRRSYVTEMYERCQARVLEMEPDIQESALPKQTKLLVKSLLGGNYAILEDLIAQGCATEECRSQDELKQLVKDKGGVLRAVKETEQFIGDEEENVTGNGIKTVEEFDETPDKNGRTLYKMVNIGKTKAHRHQMACRYAIKRFLVDLYIAWRTLEGLVVTEEFSVEKLGGEHGQPKDPGFQLDSVKIIKDTVFELETFSYAELLLAVEEKLGHAPEDEINRYLRQLMSMAMLEHDETKSLYHVTL